MGEMSNIYKLFKSQLMLTGLSRLNLFAGLIYLVWCRLFADQRQHIHAKPGQGRCVSRLAGVAVGMVTARLVWGVYVLYAECGRL